MSDSRTDLPQPPADPWGRPFEPAAPPYGAEYGYGYAYGAPAYEPSPIAAEHERLRPSARWMNFDPERRVPRWGMPDILLGLLVWFVATLAVMIPVLLLTTDKAIINIVGLVGSWIGMVGYLVLVARWKGQGSVIKDFGFRFRWFDPLIGLAAGLATVILVAIVVTVVAGLFGAPPGENADTVFQDKSNLTLVIITALMASIGAPLVEELFFRGLVLRSIEKRLGPIVGVAGSSAVFGLLHYPGGNVGSAISLVVGIGVMGTVFALLTRWQGRLGPSIFTHMTINTLASAQLIASVVNT